MRKIGCLFTGGIAATYNNQRLVAKDRQGTIARGTISHTFAFKLGLTGDTKVPVRCADSDNYALAFKKLVVSPELEWPSAEIYLGNLHAIFDTRAEALGLLLHPHHHLDAINAVWKTGEVFHYTGSGKQPTRLVR